MEEENKNKEDHYQQTQSTSSPGVLGEEATRKKNKVSENKDEIKSETAHEEGLNEANSTGTAGAFEGFENPDR